MIELLLKNILHLNLCRPDCTQAERVEVIMKVAKGEFSAEQLKFWLASRIKVIPSIFKSGTITIRHT